MEASFSRLFINNLDEALSFEVLEHAAAVCDLAIVHRPRVQMRKRRAQLCPCVSLPTRTRLIQFAAITLEAEGACAPKLCERRRAINIRTNHTAITEASFAVTASLAEMLGLLGSTELGLRHA